MAGEAMYIAKMITRIAQDVLTQLDGISNEDLNKTLSLPESNTLYALATHLVGAGEFWTLVMAGGKEIPRDRPSEFQASGTTAELVTRYQRWLADLHAVIDPLPDEHMEQPVEPPASYRYVSNIEPITVREALLHALEHSALHLGHIQLTRQVLGYAPPQA